MPHKQNAHGDSRRKIPSAGIRTYRDEVLWEMFLPFRARKQFRSDFNRIYFLGNPCHLAGKGQIASANIQNYIHRSDLFQYCPISIRVISCELKFPSSIGVSL